jgi:hypothetical protein
MKTSIIYLGLILSTLTTSNASNGLNLQDADQQNFTLLSMVNSDQNNYATTVSQKEGKIDADTTNSDLVIFSPSTVIANTNVKTIEEIIAEDKLITENSDEAPQYLSIETTEEDKIAEQNLIIESTITDEVFPLDFERINSASKSIQMNATSLKKAAIKL